MTRAFVLLMACFASIVMSAQQLHWTPVDEGLYSGSTGIIAVVQIDGVEQTSTQLTPLLDRPPNYPLPQR